MNDFGMQGVSQAAVEHADLPSATRSAMVEIPPGGSFDLHVGPLAKRIGDVAFPMLGYNGSIPGPTLRVRQGSEVLVHVTNGTDVHTTVHWHGLRLENPFDGVPDETQRPIPPRGTYTHRLRFPDAGLFWYHPHVREDYQQELGLYGNVLVEPSDEQYWAPVSHELVLTLDDILIEDGAIAPFDPHAVNFAAMGRFGNVLLVAGEQQQAIDLQAGDTVRFWLTNTANTRVFNVAVPGVRLKLVGADAGRYEHETWVDHAVIAPSERVVLDARFDHAGTFTLQHATPGGVHPLALLNVVTSATPATSAEDFEVLRSDPAMAETRRRIAPYLDVPPDKTLVLVAQMDMTGASEHHHDMDHHAMQHQSTDADADGIEWEDGMLEANRATTAATMHWKIVDREANTENAAIDWIFDVGDQVKIRILNTMDSDHPMHHPFHIHGERFVVLARDGMVEDNLVWKDTVLIRQGETVDILLDASNPGLWMAHCHIPEHMASGMMFHFRVRGTRVGGLLE